jgi:ribosomal protein L4
MKTKAMFTILSQKLKDGNIIFVDSLSMKAPKTADAKAIITALSKVESFRKITMKKKNAALFTLSKKDINVEKSFQNIGSVSLDELRNVSPLDLLNSTFLVIENPEESIKILESKLA